MTYWVVEVREGRPGAPGGVLRRFTFKDELQAWSCWANAIRWGLKAEAWKVRRFR